MLPLPLPPSHPAPAFAVLVLVSSQFSQDSILAQGITPGPPVTHLLLPPLNKHNPEDVVVV